MNNQKEVRESVPPPIGSRVRIIRPGWANGLIGTVRSHARLHEGAKDAEGGRTIRGDQGARDADGNLVCGHDFTVLLDNPVSTRWPAHPIGDATWLLQWEVEVIG